MREKILNCSHSKQCDYENKWDIYRNFKIK